MRRLASIDIGTNSIRLLIADTNNEIYNRQKFMSITRLGKGVDQNGMLSEESMQKNILALKSFVDRAKNEQAEEIYVVGTAALRDSKNREKFISRAKDCTGVDVNIIGGNEEAMLGFFGAVKGLKKEGYVLLVDIGGGSTELILGSTFKGIIFSESIQIGALRLTEKFIKHTDLPVNHEEILAMEAYITQMAKETIDKLLDYTIKDLVGIGGTVTSFSAMIQGMETYDPEQVHNSIMDIRAIGAKLNELENLDLKHRKMTLGLQADRADIIVAGGIILKTLMEMLKHDIIIVSEYDNLEGILYKNIN